MKNTTLLLFLLPLLFLAACGGGSGEGTLDQKKAELAKYKSEVDALNVKIEALEKEIATLDPAAKSAGNARMVSAEEARATSFSHYIDLQGSIDAKNSVMVTAGMPGLIKKVYVKEGQSVVAGQAIADIEAGAMLESIKQLETNIALAKTAYDKQKSLWDQKIGTEMQYLQVKTQYESLLQQLASVNEQLKLTHVVAPISGTIEDVFAKVGTMGSPGFPIVNLVNTGTLQAKAKVPDVYASKVRQGAPVKITFPDLNESINTNISFIGNSVNPMSRTFTIECNIPQRNSIKANMYCKISINDETLANAVVVSENVVQEDTKGKYIFVVKDQGGQTRAAKQYVTVGSNYDGKVHIVDGLKAGEKFVSFGFQSIADGQLISVQ